MTKEGDGMYLLNSIDVPTPLLYARTVRLEAEAEIPGKEMCKFFHSESGCFSFPLLTAWPRRCPLVCNPLHNLTSPQFI